MSKSDLVTHGFAFLVSIAASNLVFATSARADNYGFEPGDSCSAEQSQQLIVGLKQIEIKHPENIALRDFVGQVEATQKHKSEKKRTQEFGRLLGFKSKPRSSDEVVKALNERLEATGVSKDEINVLFTSLTAKERKQ